VRQKRRNFSYTTNTTRRNSSPTSFKHTPSIKYFFKNIRSSNSAFAFASLEANIVQNVCCGPSVFKIQGQVYHHQSSILPYDPSQWAFAQLYIMEADSAGAQRTRNAEGHCNAGPLAELSAYYHRLNQHGQSYKMLLEILDAQEAKRNQVPLKYYFLLRVKDRKNVQHDI
jgi:hypothetical protein